MNGLDLAKRVGGPTKLSAILGVSRQMIYRWERVPAEWALKAERLTGTPLWKLRPDLWPPPKRKRAA